MTCDVIVAACVPLEHHVVWSIQPASSVIAHAVKYRPQRVGTTVCRPQRVGTTVCDKLTPLQAGHVMGSDQSRSGREGKRRADTGFGERCGKKSRFGYYCPVAGVTANGPGGRSVDARSTKSKLISHVDFDFWVVVVVVFLLSLLSIFQRGNLKKTNEQPHLRCNYT